MVKLKNIIRQLSEKDCKQIYDSLIDSNAEKSAYLLKALRGRQLSDSKIMAELDININAYYVLRSRLNQKIEEHLLAQMESPRTDLLWKVANLNEVLFTKKKIISIATLKKLEKQLLDYDLASELVIVYKSLKKLHINSPEYFNYSQLYNRYVAYIIAIDKAEDLLAEYFKRYGNYFFTSNETEKTILVLIVKEMQKIAKLYDSHRLYIYQSCMEVFHTLFIDQDDNIQRTGESMEDIFTQTQKIFDIYNLSPLYFRLSLIFTFLRLEYYNHYKVYRQAEKYFEEVNDVASNLLMNYSTFTFSEQFLISKVERSLRLGTEQKLYIENEILFADIEMDILDPPKYVIYIVYRALCAFYVGKYEEATKLLNSLLNEVSLKHYPLVLIEVKALLALQYCLLSEFELFLQHTNSIQRQVRIMENNKVENVFLFLKILKTATSKNKKDKQKKITAIIAKFKAMKVNYFAPTYMIKFDDALIKRLTPLEIEGNKN